MPLLRYFTPRSVMGVQAAFFLTSGLWPLLSYHTFEAVSGKKVDDWLVKTVSSLILVSGTALALTVRRGEITPAARAVSIGTSSALGGSALWYSLRGRIRKVYLLDALTEGTFLLASVAAQVRARRLEAERAAARREDVPVTSWSM